jgi:hypothetical protein
MNLKDYKNFQKKNEYLKNLITDLENKNDRIALLWALTNSKKINRRQFKELINKL